MTNRPTNLANEFDANYERCRALGLHGIIANWNEVNNKPWLKQLIEYEEEERGRRSLERRTKNSKLGQFRPLADFNWQWPTKIDQAQIQEVMQLDFIAENANVILVGPNGVGKTMIAENIVHQAIQEGHTALITTASTLLNDLAGRETGTALQRRLNWYAKPQVLFIDEVGYLSTSNRHADLLFEVINWRYQKKSTILTTNKPFTEWNKVFPSAGCVVTMIDRLIHKADVIEIQGESYRLKEAKERDLARRKKRRAAKKKQTKNKETQ